MHIDDSTIYIAKSPNEGQGSEFNRPFNQLQNKQ